MESSVSRALYGEMKRARAGTVPQPSAAPIAYAIR
jgi:hypothetical protein